MADVELQTQRAPSSTRPEVETASGRIVGTTANGVHVFKGIPYGRSTAGEGRFQAPRAPVSWSGVRDAFDYGPMCPQGGGEGQQIVAVRTILTNASGNGAFSVAVPALPAGHAVTATATNQATGDTSRFSLCGTV